MRWILVILLAYAVLLLQTTVVQWIILDTEALGAIGVDLAAIVAVFLALHGRSTSDVMIAGWIFGLGVDLTVSGGFGSTTVVGPMPIGYALAAAAIFQIRELLFRDWFVTQAILTLLFCLMAHGVWILWQSLATTQPFSLALLGELALQGLLLSIYTALLAPLGHFVMRFFRGALIPASGARTSRKAAG